MPVTDQALLIINPISGTRSKEGLPETAAARLASAGFEVTAVHTKAPGHGAELAANAAAKGVHTVISAGGDGTVNEIASALSHTGTRLGIIPLGSGNGLARSLGIPQDTDAALSVIASRNTALCDRGLVNGRPFYCTFGVGFDAAVSEKFARNKRRGRITYVQSVLREFLNYRSQPYAIAVEGRIITERAFLIAVCNASQYGNNAYIAPQASLSDGLLDLIVVHEGSPLSAVKMGVDLMAGSIDRNTRIDTFRIKGCTISRLDGGPVHLDGEPLRLDNRLEITCDSAAIDIYAPLKTEEFKPIVSPLRALIDDIRYDVKAKLKGLQ